jgi:ribonucleoside-triphosphate reductase (thioredoxin)
VERTRAILCASYLFVPKKEKEKMLVKTKEALLNDTTASVPQDFRSSGKYFDTLFQEYVYVSRYSRFLHEMGRRETWTETVNRYFDFYEQHLRERCGYELPYVLRNELEQAVLNLEVMPSMRCLMAAGPALIRDEMAGFNCSYATVDNPKVFAEILYILMVGTGVGFSVERQHVNKLPEIPEELYPTDTTIVISDSKIGWAKGLNELVSILFTGYIPKVDYSRVRPAGSVLKTFGGRASGPEPLKRCLDYIVSTFKEAKGRKLTSLECHDIICMVGECVVSGGVRRSATISLSNLSDDRMRAAKSGQWWTTTPWRSLANNSAVYNDRRPSMDVFMSEWKSLYDSKSGERGIFSRFAARNVIERSNSFRKEFCSDIEGVRYRGTEFE